MPSLHWSATPLTDAVPGNVGQPFETYAVLRDTVSLRYSKCTCIAIVTVFWYKSIWNGLCKCAAVTIAIVPVLVITDYGCLVDCSVTSQKYKNCLTFS